MRTLRRFLKRLVTSLLGRRDEERLGEEIEAHLAFLTAESLRAGLPPEEARRQALLKFGGVEAIKEEYRGQRGLPLLETVPQDARHALRRLRKSPVFTLTTTATLALGIGATTAIFTLSEAILLRSLPVANPGQLYRLGKTPGCCVSGGYSQGSEFSLVSYDLYKHFRDYTQVPPRNRILCRRSWLISRPGFRSIVESRNLLSGFTLVAPQNCTARSEKTCVPTLPTLHAARP